MHVHLKRVKARNKQHTGIKAMRKECSIVSKKQNKSTMRAGNPWKWSSNASNQHKLDFIRLKEKISTDPTKLICSRIEGLDNYRGLESIKNICRFRTFSFNN